MITIHQKVNSILAFPIVNIRLRIFHIIRIHFLFHLINAQQILSRINQLLRLDNQWWFNVMVIMVMLAEVIVWDMPLTAMFSFSLVFSWWESVRLFWLQLDKMGRFRLVSELYYGLWRFERAIFHFLIMFIFILFCASI